MTNPPNLKIPTSAPTDITVYEYGIRLDKECEPRVWEQIKKSRELYNNIIAAIRAIFDGMNAFVIERAGLEAKALANEINKLSEEDFKAAKAARNEDLLKEIARIRKEKRILLSEMLKKVRTEYKSDIQKQFFSQIGLNSRCITYKLRSDAVAQGLGWGTANAILTRLSRPASPRSALFTCIHSWMATGAFRASYSIRRYARPANLRPDTCCRFLPP
jgi:hypothetical protein